MTVAVVQAILVTHRHIMWAIEQYVTYLLDHLNRAVVRAVKMAIERAMRKKRTDRRATA